MLLPSKSEAENRNLDLPGERTLDLPGVRSLDLPEERSLDLPGERSLDLPASGMYDTYACVQVLASFLFSLLEFGCLRKIKYSVVRET